jgi:hypothetical protein
VTWPTSSINEKKYNNELKDELKEFNYALIATHARPKSSTKPKLK